MWVADEQALVRAGSSLLSAGGFEVVAEADTGVPALAAARKLHPDVVLMDIGCRRWTGSQRRGRSPPTRISADVRVVVLTTFELDEYVFEAMRVRGERLPGKTHRADGTRKGGAGGRRRRRCCARR